MSDVQYPSVGRIVHYCIGWAVDGKPVYLPAIVVANWGGLACNLQVFVDGTNSLRDRYHDLNSPTRYAGPCEEECARGLAWRTSVPYDDADGAGVGTWRWPPRVA